MRFARLHPSFLIFFFLSLASVAAALVLGIVASDACSGAGSAAAADGHCAIEAQGESTMAIVLAVGGLTAMLGGVGFQIGRTRPAAPTTTPPAAGAPWPGTSGLPPHGPRS
jgi:hypothetical protein